MICTQRDNYVVNYQESNPSWIVELESGLVVFQDDFRPGVEPFSAWERLYNHCHTEKDYIRGMTIKFRSNAQRIPDNADGYYFSKGVRGALFLTRTINLFFVGTLNEGVLRVQCWKVPEMLPEAIEERDIKKAGLCLISRDTPPTWAQHAR